MESDSSFTVDWDRWVPVDRAVLTFVRRAEGGVLLIIKKRGLGAGKINAPGGRIEPGETPEQAAVRETQEETGVTPSGLKQAGVLDFVFADGYSLACTVFTASDCTGRLIETEEAVPFWSRETAIPYDRMWVDDGIWLPRMLSEIPFACRFIFDGDRMLFHEDRTD